MEAFCADCVLKIAGSEINYWRKVNFRPFLVHCTAAGYIILFYKNITFSALYVVGGLVGSSIVCLLQLILLIGQRGGTKRISGREH